MRIPKTDYEPMLKYQWSIKSNKCPVPISQVSEVITLCIHVILQYEVPLPDSNAFFILWDYYIIENLLIVLSPLLRTDQDTSISTISPKVLIIAFIEPAGIDRPGVAIRSAFFEHLQSQQWSFQNLALRNSHYV